MSPFAISGRMLCVHILRRRHLQENTPCSLLPGQAYLLRTVIGNPGLTQRGIAERLGVSAASIAQSAGCLEEAGLLTRRPSEADRRRNMLFATEAGKAEEGRFRARLDAIDARMLEGVSEPEQELLVSILDRMLENLKSDGFDPSDFLSMKDGCNV